MSTQDPIRAIIRKRIGLLAEDEPAVAPVAPPPQEPPQQKPDTLRTAIRSRIEGLGEPDLLTRGPRIFGATPAEILEPGLRAPRTRQPPAPAAPPPGPVADTARWTPDQLEEYVAGTAEAAKRDPEFLKFFEEQHPDTATIRKVQERVRGETTAPPRRPRAAPSPKKKGRQSFMDRVDENIRGVAPELAPPEPPQRESDPHTEMVSGFVAGIKGTTPEMFGSTAQAFGFNEVGQALEAYGASQREARPAAVPSMRDVHSPDDAIDYAAYQFGQGVASTLPSYGGGMAGAAAGAAIGSIVPGLGTAAGAAVGGVAGAIGPAFALNAGEMRQELIKAGVTDPDALKRATMIGGGIMAVLDLPLVEMGIGRIFGKGARDAVKRTLVKRLVKGWAEGTLIEGGTELLQDVVEKATIKAETGAPVFTKENWWSFMENAVGGALVGGPFGGFGGAFEGAGAPAGAAEEENAAQPGPRVGKEPGAEAAPEPAPEPAAPAPGIRQKVADFIAPEGAAERENLREQRDQARREAETDKLTGLGNRAAFDRALPAAESDPKTSVVLFDLENLKAVNDTQGDAAGDAAITRAAEAIRERVPRAFRHGGDELAAIIPADQAEAVARDIREAFGEEDVGGFPLRIRYGIGQTRAEADAAVREAKKQRTGPAYRPGATAEWTPAPRETPKPPARVYHGTQRGVDAPLDISKAADTGLYGPALYFTDDPEMAGGVVTPEGKVEGGYAVGGMAAEQLAQRDDRIAEAEAAANDARFRLLEATQRGEDTTELEKKADAAEAEHERLIQEGAESPTVRVASINPKNVLDLDAPMDPGVADRVLEDLEKRANGRDRQDIRDFREMLRTEKPGDFLDAAADFYKGLVQSDLDISKSQLNDALRAAGFDAMTHEAGNDWGLAAGEGKRHRVWAVLDQAAVKEGLGGPEPAPARKGPTLEEARSREKEAERTKAGEPVQMTQREAADRLKTLKRGDRIVIPMDDEEGDVVYTVNANGNLESDYEILEPNDKAAAELLQERGARIETSKDEAQADLLEQPAEPAEPKKPVSRAQRDRFSKLSDASLVNLYSGAVRRQGPGPLTVDVADSQAEIERRGLDLGAAYRGRVQKRAVEAPEKPAEAPATEPTPEPEVAPAAAEEPRPEAESRTYDEWQALVDAREDALVAAGEDITTSEDPELRRLYEQRNAVMDREDAAEVETVAAKVEDGPVSPEDVKQVVHGIHRDYAQFYRRNRLSLGPREVEGVFRAIFSAISERAARAGKFPGALIGDLDASVEVARDWPNVQYGQNTEPVLRQAMSVMRAFGAPIPEGVEGTAALPGPSAAAGFTRDNPMELGPNRYAYKDGDTWHVWDQKGNAWVAFPNDPGHPGYRVWKAMEAEAAKRPKPAVTFKKAKIVPTREGVRAEPIREETAESETPNQTFERMAREDAEFARSLDALPVGTTFTLTDLPGNRATEGTWKRVNLKGDRFWLKKEGIGETYVPSSNFAAYKQEVRESLGAAAAPAGPKITQVVSPAIARREGGAAFARGEPRVVPAEYATASEKKAWYAGWDSANLAAPLIGEKPAEKPAAAKPASRLEEIRNSARARIEARQKGGPKLQAGLDPTDLYDYAIIGATYMAEGTTKVATWTSKMVQEFGEEIRQHLQRIRDLASKIANGEKVVWAGVGKDLADELQASADELAAINRVNAQYADLLGTPEEEENAGPPTVEEPGGGGVEGTRPGEVPGAEEQPEAGGLPGPGGKPGPGAIRLPGEGHPGEEPGAAGGVGEAGGAGVGGEGRPGAVRDAIRGENYRIQPEDLTKLGGPKTRARTNLEAIRIVKRLEEERRHATHEEQQTLVKYVGWGGLSQMFPRQLASWERNLRGKRELYTEGWADLGEELAGLLTEEEYAAARESTQWAHFTTPEVVNGIFNGLKRLGVQGNVHALEPGAGIGHFLGLSPFAGHWTAVEKDHITAAILAALYPNADVRAQEYQDVVMPDGSFDVVVGNPPFGDIPIADRRYGRRAHMIHDYFFVKSLDKLRPGGVLAFVTSTGTMDKASRVSRVAIGDRADFLGAVRLPGNAFKEAAGTEVTTDILFFRRRDVGEPPKHAAEWMGLGKVDNWKINEYFVAHPEQILGRLEKDKLHPQRAGVVALPGVDIADALNEALERLPENAYGTEVVRTEEKPLDRRVPENAKEGQYVIHRGEIMEVRGGRLHSLEIAKEGALAERIGQLVEMGEAARDVIDATSRGVADAELKPLQKRLSGLYDRFVAKYGPINLKKVSERKDGKLVERRPNLLRYNDPVNGPLVRALENYNEETGEATKTAIHSKRLLNVAKLADTVDTAWKGVVASLVRYGRVDMPFIEKLYGKSETEIATELGDRIFLDPQTGLWETRETYLSGNVRAKLAEAQLAAEKDGRFTVNVSALEEVQPQYVSVAQMRRQGAAAFGATWIPVDVYQDFAHKVIGMADVPITYREADGAYSIKSGRVWRKAKYAEWSTSRVQAIELLRDLLNNRPTKVTFRDPTTRHVIEDTEATAAAEAKKREIQKKFEDWIYEDDANRTLELNRTYNEKMNHTVLTEWDGSHFLGNMPGMSAMFRGDKLELAAHQVNAIWRILASGNTLLAHEVGAGKTMAMVAAGMEAKRMGLVRKPMYAVPNAMLGQFSRELLELYPGAKILVADDYQFHSARRREFLARVASDDWDGVIFTHSALKLIPNDPATTRDVLNTILAEYQEALLQARQEGDRFTVKALENAVKKYGEKLKDLAAVQRTDQVVYWEQLGVDMLIVDEAHEFKNLALPSLSSGINLTDAEKTMDLYIKTRFVEKVNPGRGLVFATATPISNSIAEMYVMMRYLMEPKLRDMGYGAFDAWAHDYVASWSEKEYTAIGTLEDKVRPRAYRSAFSMAQMFRSVADIKTRKELKLSTPDVIGGAPEIVVVPGSPRLKAFMKALQKRWKKRPKKPEKGDDGVFPIMNDGRFASVDARLVTSGHAQAEGHDPNVPWDHSKAEYVVDRVFDIWKEHEAVRGTQLIFSDLGVPKQYAAAEIKETAALLREEYAGRNISEEEILAEAKALVEQQGAYDLYNDLRDRLVEKGIPREEIAFVQEGGSNKKKRQAIIDRTKRGVVRVLIGSTPMMGQGVNVQDRLVALHHIDVPYKPAWLQQRDGRIERQGNDLWARGEIPGIRILRYVLEGSYDPKAWQILENKIGFIEQAMTARADVGMVEEVGGSTLTTKDVYGIIKAQASDNPYAMEFATAEGKLATLWQQRREWKDKDHTYRQNIGQYTYRMNEAKRAARSAAADVKALPETDPVGEKFSITLSGKEITDRENAGAALLAQFDAMSDSGVKAKQRVERKVGTYAGMPLRLKFNPFWSQSQGRYEFTLEGSGQEYAAIPNVEGRSATGIVSSLENLIEKIRKAPEWYQAEATKIQADIDETGKLIGQPFPQEAELDVAQQRVDELQKLMQEHGKETAEPDHTKPADDGDGGTTLHTFGLGVALQMAKQTGVAQRAERVTTGVAGIARYGYDVLSDDLINVVRKQGAGGEWFARRAEKALDFTKVVFGRLGPRMKRTLHRVSFGPKAERAASWLQTIERDGASGFANIQGALEGTRADMPERAAEWVADQRRLQWRMGKMGETAKVYGRRERGLLQLLPGGRIRAFKATPGGKIALRMSTRFLSDMYLNPRGAAWDTYVDELARLNNLKPPQVRRILEPVTGKRFARTHAEVPRLFRVHPTHIYVMTPFGERLIPLLETHPYRYTAASVRSFSNRLGFVRQFGQSLVKHDPKHGRFDQLETLRDKAIQRGVDGTDADNMLRALSGVPIERPLFNVASPMFEVTDAIQQLFGAIKAGMLTRAWVPNITEFLGNITVFGGTARTLRALAELGTDWRRVVPLLERHGIAIADVADLTMDRDRWLASQVRRWGQGVLRIFPTQPVWNWQEKHAAVVGLRLAEDIQSQRGSEFSKAMDFFTLRWLGYSKKEAQNLIDGKGSNEEYLGIARRFAARSNTTRITLPAEESRATNSRLWRAWMWFTRYPSMKARSLGRVTGLLWEALQEQKKNPSPRNLRRLGVAATKFAQYNFGTAMSGAAQYAIITLLLGGTAGLAATWREAEDDWLKFLVQSWGWAQLGPIITSLGRVWNDRQLDHWWMFSAPLSVLYETANAFLGLDKYDGLSAGERAQKWGSRHMPGPRALHALFTAMGLAEKNTALDTASREYWAWRRREIGAPGRFQPGDSPEDQQAFRRAMRKAYEVMKRPDALARDQEIRDLLNAALGVEGKDINSVRQSIRARKLLPRLTEEQRTAFHDYSPESYRVLEEHDAMLEAWASTGSRRRRPATTRQRRQRTTKF